MKISDLLKQTTIHCPQCHNAFEMGPDFQAITDSAGNLLDKVAGMFSDNPFGVLCEEIADHFGYPYEDAVQALSDALSDEAIKDSIFDFLEEDEEDPDEEE